MEFIRNTERRKYQRGPHPGHECGGHALPPGRAPLSRGPPGRPPVPIFCYMKSFVREKIISKLTGRNSAATRRNQSRALAELFCWGNFPPGGGNHRQRHHQYSSHQGRAISINIFISTISSQNPSSSLVSNSCLQVQDWC